MDHIVMTVTSMDATINFYVDVLKMEKVVFKQDRIALKFGNQKINLHPLKNNITPKANHPTPGSLDLCFRTTEPLANIIEHIEACKVEIILGPIERTGANGKMISIYLRDPDENLIEISNYLAWFT